MTTTPFEETSWKLTIIVKSKLEGIDKVCKWYKTVQRIIDQHNPDTKHIHKLLIRCISQRNSSCNS